MNSNWQSVIADLLKKGKALQRDMDAILQNDKSNVNVSESNTNFRTVSPTNIPIKLNLTDELKKVSLTDNGNKDVRVAGEESLSFNDMQNLLDSHLISASFESEDLSDSDDFSHAEAFNNVWFPDDFINGKERDPCLSDKMDAGKAIRNPIKRPPSFKSSSLQKRVKPKPSSPSLPSKRNQSRKPYLLNVKPKLKTSLSEVVCSPDVNNKRQSSRETSSDIEPLLLHCLVLVPTGTGFTSSTKSKYWHAGIRRNLFIVCRMFWTDDTVHSRVCWSNGNPHFDFCQVAPVLISKPLLQRMQNNIMVIEVWEKKFSTKSDEIVGVCKLPLHIFYLSFRDKAIAKSIIQSTKAVIAVNDHVNTVDIFSGKIVGKLKVVLAMGTHDQIGHIQETFHVCDQSVVNDSVLTKSDMYVRYTFEISINFLQFGHPPGSNIWGESDCCVRYAFPSHDKNSVTVDDWELRTYTIGPRLCEPKVYFKSSLEHELIQLDSVPLETCFMRAFSDEVIFQIWCKYYYPVECNELVAKAYLPLSNLFTLLSRKERKSSKESFLLRLLPCGRFSFCHDKGIKLGSLGVMEVEVKCESQYFSGTNAVLKDNLTETTDRQDKTAQACSSCSKYLQPETVPRPEKLETRNSGISLRILVERGNHLPNTKSSMSDVEISPNGVCSISHPKLDGASPLTSNVAVANNHPCWNWRTEVFLPNDIVLEKHKHILISVWHIDVTHTVSEGWNTDLENKGTLIGTAYVDLMPLLLGMRQLNGWYNIINFEGICKGQIKVAIEPLFSLEEFHSSLKNGLVGRDVIDTISNLAWYPDINYQPGSSIEKSPKFEDDVNEIMVSSSIENSDNTPNGVNREKSYETSRSFLLANLRENINNMEMVVNQCLKGLDKMNKRNISHTSEDDGSDSRKCSMICNSCDSQSGKHDVESDCHEEEIIILPNTINSTSNDLPVNTNSSQHLSQTEAGGRSRRCSRLAASIFTNE